jgi:hypothetical protein
MRVIQTANSNHNFGPPQGNEEIIGDLPCQIEEGVAAYGGGRVIWSVWEPTEAERKAIANGQNVRLGVGWIGGFPPVSVGVTHETELETGVAEEAAEFLEEVDRG